MCDNEEIILSNIRGVKISSPDVRLAEASQDSQLTDGTSTEDGTQRRLSQTTYSASGIMSSTMSLSKRRTYRASVS